jgi:hypothetical protein
MTTTTTTTTRRRRRRRRHDDDDDDADADDDDDTDSSTPPHRTALVVASDHFAVVCALADAVHVAVAALLVLHERVLAAVVVLVRRALVGLRAHRHVFVHLQRRDTVASDVSIPRADASVQLTASARASRSTTQPHVRRTPPTTAAALRV